MSIRHKTRSVIIQEFKKVPRIHMAFSVPVPIPYHKNCSKWMDHLILYIGLLLLLFESNIASAQNKDSIASMTITGFIDLYYSHNFANPTENINRQRNFDISGNNTILSLCEIVIQKKSEPIGFRIDADFGETNDIVQSSMTSSQNILQQAYLTAIVPIGSGLILDVGKFVTHMGYEVIEAKDNWNYSRSTLFAYAIPYFHTGIRGSYCPISNFTICAHVYNGWNNASFDNKGKTLGASIIYSPSNNVTITGNYIGGFEQPDSLGTGRRDVFDFYCTIQASEDLFFALNADYGLEPQIVRTNHWKGITLYGKYNFTDTFAFAIRGEIYADPEGATTGIAQDLTSITTTIEYRINSSFILRGEARHDASTAKVFDNETDADKIGYQNTITLASIVLF